ncbi:MAG: hypothetical protein RI894_2249 [Bacteroidota bacterium]|jgi:tetratricopeptide (TPR) repeat protein
MRIISILSLFLFFASSANAQSALKMYFKGKQAYEADSLHESIKYYTEALTGNMEKPYMGYIARGVAYMRVAYFKKALADFNAAHELQIERSEPLLCCAQANLALRNYDEAVRNCTQALRINNLEDRAYQLRAQAYLENGNTIDAIEDFDRTLKLHPTAAGFNDRGFAKFLLGQIESAIADFDQALKLDKEFLPAYRNRAKARLNLGDQIAALEDYNQALELAHDADTYTARGLLLHRLGEYTKAIADFDAALRINPYHSQARQAREVAKTARSNRDSEKS